MGTTCNEGPLHTTILRQIYLYWQWPFGTPEKIVGTWLQVIIGAMWIAKPWGETSAGSVLDCPIKVGGECAVFSTVPVLYTPNWTTVYPVMQVLMGGGKLMSSRFGFLLFIICFLGDPVTYLFYPSGSKHRLDPRALSWCNIRERSFLCLPSARCEPCVLE